MVISCCNGVFGSLAQPPLRVSNSGSVVMELAGPKSVLDVG